MNYPVVGFVGLGQMGRPMALRLADWPGGLWVYDVDPAATAKLAEAGVKVAQSPRELAEQASFVSVMVRDDDQVRAVLASLLETAAPGTTVAVHSTIAPGTPAELAELAAPSGVEVLDAPVSGGFMGATDGRLAIMVGGASHAVERSRPVLEKMGALVAHLGPIGAGTRAKLARNLLHFVAFTAATEAARLAEAAGIDLVELGKIVRHTDAITGGAGAIMLRDSTAPVARDDPWFRILDNVRLLGEKDLRFALELAGELDVQAPLARLALDRLGAGLGVPQKENP
jgi:3-hydroxyisobutyrate dehydrogenase